jgi:hypothetical protein
MKRGRSAQSDCAADDAAEAPTTEARGGTQPHASSLASPRQEVDSDRVPLQGQEAREGGGPPVVALALRGRSLDDGAEDRRRASEGGRDELCRALRRAAGHPAPVQSAQAPADEPAAESLPAARAHALRSGASFGLVTFVHSRALVDDNCKRMRVAGGDEEGLGHDHVGAAMTAQALEIERLRNELGELVKREQLQQGKIEQLLQGKADALQRQFLKMGSRDQHGAAAGG